MYVGWYKISVWRKMSSGTKTKLKCLPRFAFFSTTGKQNYFIISSLWLTVCVNFAMQQMYIQHFSKCALQSSIFSLILYFILAKFQIPNFTSPSSFNAQNSTKIKCFCLFSLAHCSLYILFKTIPHTCLIVSLAEIISMQYHFGWFACVMLFHPLHMHIP